MSEVLRHVIDSISPASQAHAVGARAHVAGVGAPVLERLAVALAGAQHAPRPRATPRSLVIIAGDHGVGDPGVLLGADHPTVLAAGAIAAGTAAVAQVARSSATPIVLVDAGAREGAFMPAVAIRLGRGPSSDLLAGPAMTVVDAILGLEAGIALAMALCPNVMETTVPTIMETAREHDVADTSRGQPGGIAAADPLSGCPAVLALGAIGLGAEVASAALLGAATGHGPTGLDDDAAELAGARGAAMVGASGLELLAAFGGPETAVLAGLILGAASIDVPVILDSYATGAAALVAVALAPHAAGYMIAAHRGSFTQPAIVAHLGLVPLFEVGLGHGDGTGAAMVLPLIDQVAALAHRG